MPQKKPGRTMRLSRETLLELTTPASLVGSFQCCSNPFKCFNTICPGCVNEH